MINDDEEVQIGTAPSKTRILCIQILTALATALQLLAPGMSLGFSAITLSQLREYDPEFEPLNNQQASWFASISTGATAVGCVVAAWSLERLGRRKSFFLLAVPGVAGWSMLAFASSHFQLMTGRALTGLALGIASSPVVVYLGEVITPKLRGALLCWNSISIALGVLTSFTLGTLLTWRQVAVVGAGITILGFLAALMMPESPLWLVTRADRLDLAEKCLKKLRGGKGASVRTELESLVRLKQQTNQESESGVRKFMKAIRQPEFWKPLLILHILFFLSQVAGIYVVMYYAVDIVVAAGATDDIKYLMTILIGVMRLVVTIALSVAMTSFGRRPATLISGCGMTVCMSGLAILPYLGSVGPWPGCILILIFVGTSTVGFLTIPWTMMGEMFPSDLRGVGGGITTFTNNLLSFIVVKVYPSVNEGLGSQMTFLMFAGFALTATVFVAIWLPETAGKTLEEVQAGFASKNKNRRSSVESVALTQNTKS